MAHEVDPKPFDTYQQVKEYYLKNPKCRLLGSYLAIFRVNCTKELTRPELDEHVFMAVNMRTLMEIDIPHAVLPKNRCSGKENEEIHRIKFWQFNDGDPEDDGYDEILETSRERELLPPLDKMIIN